MMLEQNTIYLPLRLVMCLSIITSDPSAVSKACRSTPKDQCRKILAQLNIEKGFHHSGQVKDARLFLFSDNIKRAGS